LRAFAHQETADRHGTDRHAHRYPARRDGAAGRRRLGQRGAVQHRPRLRANQNRVIYFAGYRLPDDLFRREDIEAATDQVVWACDVEPPIEPRRTQDRAFVGNIVQAMTAYAQGELGAPVCEAPNICLAPRSRSRSRPTCRSRRTTRR